MTQVRESEGEGIGENMRTDGRILRWRLRSLAVIATLGISLMAQTSASGPKLGKGESLSILRLTLRGNYVVPSQVTLPEGWCRIVVYDPHQIAGGQEIILGTDADTRLSSKSLAASSAKAEMYYRLPPGKHKLRIGTKNEWIVCSGSVGNGEGVPPLS